MDNLRQNIIDNLIFRLHAEEILTKNNNSIKFSSSTGGKQNEGEILIDDSKKGSYKIYFVDKLKLILIAKDDFKFTSFKETPKSTTAIEGVDASAIIDLVKLLSIK